MKLVYPACFYEEGDGGFSVQIPDLLGCCTQGDNLEEAIQMAQDAALGWLLTAVENNEEIPNARNIKDIKLENENAFTTLLLLDLGAYTQKYGSRKSIKKTLTIPLWLNERAERLKINFSQTLQDALMAQVLKNRK